MHLVVEGVENGHRGHLMLEIGMVIRIGMLLLEVDIAMELLQILCELLKLLVKVLRELFVANLLRAAINDQSAQVLLPLRRL